MTTSATIRIPTRFFDDHHDRDLPSPAIVKVTKSHYHIAAADPNLDELRDDAEFYADPCGPEDCARLKVAAKALLRALNARNHAA